MNIKKWRGNWWLPKSKYMAILLSFFFFLQKGNASETQVEELRVTFNLQQISVKEVIPSIAMQTGYTVKIDKQLENLSISGEFVSVDVGSFFKKALKAENLFIIISPKERIISVLTPGNRRSPKLTASGVEKELKKVDQQGLEKLTMEYEFNDIPSGQESLVIYELDDTFPPVFIGNNEHIIDSQTGKPWREVENLLK